MNGGAMVVKLQGDAEDVIALTLENASHHGGIDATGHGNDNPGIFRLLVKVERIQGFSNRQS